MATSFGTRKALGRRYAIDPALLLEAQRLEQEYGLIPGREARAMQQSQFQQGLAQQQAALAQQQSQFDTREENAKMAGMIGTGANLATTAGMIRAYTMPKGGSFFGGYLGGTPDALVGKTATAPVGMTIPNGLAGYTPASSYANMMPNPGGYQGVSGVPINTLGANSPYSVTPATIDSTTVGITGAGTGAGAASGMSQSAAAAGGIGEGVGPASFSAGSYLGPAGAGYGAPKLVEGIHPGSMENIGHNLTLGLVKDEGTAGTIGKTATGAAAGAAMGSVIPGVGTAVGGVVGGVVGFLSGVFGW